MIRIIHRSVLSGTNPDVPVGLHSPAKGPNNGIPVPGIDILVNNNENLAHIRSVAGRQIQNLPRLRRMSLFHLDYPATRTPALLMKRHIQNARDIAIVLQELVVDTLMRKLPQFAALTRGKLADKGIED